MARAHTPPILRGLGNFFRARPLLDEGQIQGLAATGRIPDAIRRELATLLHQKDLLKNPAEAQAAAGRAALLHPLPATARPYDRAAFEQTTRVRENLMDALRILRACDHINGTSLSRDAAFSALQELQVYDAEWIELLESTVLFHSQGPEEDALSAAGYVLTLNRISPAILVPMVERDHNQNLIYIILPMILRKLAEGPIELQPDSGSLESFENRLIETLEGHGRRQRNVRKQFREFRALIAGRAALPQEPESTLSTESQSDPLILAHLQEREALRVEVEAAFRARGTSLGNVLDARTIDELIFAIRRMHETRDAVIHLFYELTVRTRAQGLAFRDTSTLIWLAWDILRSHPEALAIELAITSFFELKRQAEEIGLQGWLSQTLVRQLVNLANRTHYPIREVVAAFRSVQLEATRNGIQRASARQSVLLNLTERILRNRLPPP